MAAAALGITNESSRQSTPGVNNNHSSSKKRKAAATAAAIPEPSPAPSDSTTTGPVANVTLPARHDFFSRPRLTISRFPTFPDAPNVVYHTTEQLAMNRFGFRYVPAGVAPPGSALPCRTIESSPTKFRVSWEDRSAFIKVTPDGLGLQGERGFRSARCNAPIREGAWYLEVRIECGGGERPPDALDSNMREGSHVRLGWGRREAPLNGPVGLDGYSYGYRDKSGDKIHLSRLRAYGRSFRSGDVVGMYISIPPRRTPDPADQYDPAHLKRERIPIEFKGQEYFESLEYPQSKEMISLIEYSNKASATASLPSVPLAKKSANAKSFPERKATGSQIPVRPLPQLLGSHIAFFVNGECQKSAYRDIYDYLPLRTTPTSRKKDKENSRKRAREHKENPYDDGTLGYYPFISLYNYARVKINPGPEFDFPPPPDIEALLRDEEEDIKPSCEQTWRPMCERYPEFMQEQWDLDLREEEEAKVELALKAEREQAESAQRAQKERRRKQADAKKRAKESEAQKTSASVSSICRASVEQESVPEANDSYKPTVSSLLAAVMHLPEDVEMAPSPAPTAASNADCRHMLEAGSEYESGAADGEGEVADKNAESDSRSDGVPSVDLDLEELL